MLNFFRQRLNGAAVKVLMVFLLVIFALWGVGDLFRHNPMGPRYAFKVDKIVVSENEWREAVRMQVQQMQAMTGESVSLEELQKHGFFQSLADKMINRALLLAEARRAGLVVSDDMAKLYLTTQPNFLDAEGKFNKDKLDEALRSNGMNEAQLVKIVKEEMMYENLADTLFANPFMPPQFIEVLFQAVNIGKKATLYEIDISKTKLTEQPSDELLKAIFEDKRNQFYIPQKRDIRFAALRLADIEPQNNVSDAELQTVYEQRKEMMQLPERRNIQYITLPSLEQAQKVRAEFESGKSWTDLVKQHAPKQKVEPQMVVRQALENKLGESVFNTDKNRVSIPVETPEGTHLFYIMDILPQTTLTFEQVQPELKKQYLEEKRYEQLANLAQQVEADIHNGIPFDDLTQKYKLKEQKATLTEDQRATDKDLANSGELLRQAFATEPNKISSVVPHGADQFFVLTIDTDTPRQPKEFETVRDTLIQEWTKNNQLKLASQGIEALEDALKQDADLKQVKELEKFSIASRQVKLSRANTEGLPQGWVAELMALSVGEMSKPVQVENKLAIAKINETIPAPKEGLQKLGNQPQIDRLQGEVILLQYLTNLRKKYKIDINQAVIDINNPDAL